MATPKTTVNPKAPLSVLFVAGLSTVEAVYLLFRGVADPLFGDAARAVQERLVGGIIQAFFGLIILLFALRFYRGKRTARTPMALIQACASFINASNIYSYFSYRSVVGADHAPFSFIIIPTVLLLLSGTALVAVFLPATSQYLHETTEADEADLKRHSVTGRR